MKELRLAGMATIEAANRFVEAWLPLYNQRFTVQPAQAADLHRPCNVRATHVRVEERVDEAMRITHHGRLLDYHAIPARTERVAAPPKALGVRSSRPRLIRGANGCCRHETHTRRRPSHEPDISTWGERRHFYIRLTAPVSPVDSLPTLCYPQGTCSPIVCFASTLCNAPTPMTICRSLFTHCSELFGSSNSRVAWTLLCVALLLWTPLDASAKSKPHRAPRPEPELKILDLTVFPNPYTISSGSLEFSTLVQLPKELNGASLLEVSSFITSPSKNSLRFLTTRTALEPHAASTNSAAPPQVPVLLTWDGLDHKKIPSVAGLYQFEVRAKLLANGEKGPRTQMVSWPKRGTVEVK